MTKVEKDERDVEAAIVTAPVLRTRAGDDSFRQAKTSQRLRQRGHGAALLPCQAA